jgi:hypothetical protein
VLANRDPFDFRRLVREQFVDQLLSRVSSPRDLDPPCFDGLFRDRHLFGEQREGGFGGLRGWGFWSLSSTRRSLLVLPESPVWCASAFLYALRTYPNHAAQIKNASQSLIGDLCGCDGRFLRNRASRVTARSSWDCRPHHAWKAVIGAEPPRLTPTDQPSGCGTRSKAYPVGRPRLSVAR